MFLNNGLLLHSIYDDIIFCNTTYKCINNFVNYAKMIILIKTCMFIKQYRLTLFILYNFILYKCIKMFTFMLIMYYKYH